MEWKTIINYPEHEISDTGLIRRTKAFRKYPKGYVLKPSVHEGGHLFVTLGRRKKTRCVAVHILVAEHFIGPRPKNHIVHHKDSNKANNHVSNLEYVPINEHANQPDQSIPTMPMSMLIPVRSGRSRRMTLTTKDASRLLGITPARVRQLILAGRLPAQKHGRDWIIKQSDLNTVLNRPTGRPRKE